MLVFFGKACSKGRHAFVSDCFKALMLLMHMQKRDCLLHAYRLRISHIVVYQWRKERWRTLWGHSMHL